MAVSAATKATTKRALPKKVAPKKQDLSLDRLLKTRKAPQQPVKVSADAVNIDPRADVTTPQAYKRVPTPVHLLGQVVETYTKYKSDTITGVVVAIFNEAEHQMPGKKFDPEKLIGTKSHGVEWFARVWLSPQRSHVASIRKVREIGRDATHLVADDFLRQALADSAVIARVDNYAHNQSGVQSYPTRVANLHVSPVASHYDAIIDKYRDKHPLVPDAPFVPWQQYVDEQRKLTGDQTAGAIVSVPRTSTVAKSASKTAAPSKALVKKRVLKKIVKPATKANLGSSKFYDQDEFIKEWNRVSKARAKSSVTSDTVSGATLYYSAVTGHDTVDGLSGVFAATKTGQTVVWFVAVDEDGEVVKKIWDGRPSVEAIETIDKYLFSLGQKG